MQPSETQIHNRRLSIAAGVLSGIQAILQLLYMVKNLSFFRFFYFRPSPVDIMNLLIFLSMVTFSVLVLAFPRKIRLVTIPSAILLLALSFSYSLILVPENFQRIWTFQFGLFVSLPNILVTTFALVIAVLLVLPATWSGKRWILPAILSVLITALPLLYIFSALRYWVQFVQPLELVHRLLVEPFLLLPLLLLILSFRERQTAGVSNPKQSAYAWGFSLITLIAFGLLISIPTIASEIEYLEYSVFMGGDSRYPNLMEAGNAAFLAIVATIYLFNFLLAIVALMIVALSKTGTRPTRDVALVIIFMLLFGLIYLPLWIYTISASLPTATRRSPMANAVLSLLVPFYGLWWFHRHSQELHRQFLADNRPTNDFTTLHTILYLLIPLVGIALFQSKVNEYFSQPAQAPVRAPAYAPTYAPAPAAIPAAPSNAGAAPKADPAEQIRALYNLKEQGILTDEEFQTKKAEILSRI